MTEARKMLIALEKGNKNLADKYAVPGTVKHFALRLGFMPHDEQTAEEIIVCALMEAGIL